METAREKSLRYNNQLSARNLRRANKFNKYVLISLGVLVFQGLVSLLLFKIKTTSSYLPAALVIALLVSSAAALYFLAREIFIRRWACLNQGWYLFDSAAMIFGYLLCLISAVIFIVSIFLLFYLN